MESVFQERLKKGLHSTCKSCGCSGECYQRKRKTSLQECCPYSRNALHVLLIAIQDSFRYTDGKIKKQSCSW